jgi:hypothetical protein
MVAMVYFMVVVRSGGKLLKRPLLGKDRGQKTKEMR